MNKLTDKQKRFIDEYLKDLNATQAAIRAGYSKKTARSIGQRLLTYVDIQEAIRAKQQKTKEQNDITISDLINDLKELKIYGMNNEFLLDKDGNKTNRIRKVDAKCALEAIDKIGRMIGAFEKDNNQQKVNNFSIIVN